MTKVKLTASLEDYLETLYLHLQENQSVKAIDISKTLKVSRASVTEALKKLEKEKLIHYGKYDSIVITELGIKKAKEVIQKHNVLYKFFAEILNLPEEESKENACKIEHVISKIAFEKISKFVELASEDKNFLEKIKQNLE